MNLADVMTEIGQALKSIPGLRIYDYPAEDIQPPAAIVFLPEKIEFDAAMQRGLDEMTLSLGIIVGRISDRASRDAVGKYCDGSGRHSVKATLKAHTWSTCDTIVPDEVDFDYYPLAEVDYLGAFFDLRIYGRGKPQT